MASVYTIDSIGICYFYLDDKCIYGWPKNASPKSGTFIWIADRGIDFYDGTKHQEIDMDTKLLLVRTELLKGVHKYDIMNSAITFISQ